MTEERKHAILFAATLLSARKIMDLMDEDTPNMGKQFWLDSWTGKAIEQAARMMDKIDERWPAEEEAKPIVDS